MKGIVLYKGPSKLGDQNIVVILTLKSMNKKTGDMSQTWILNQDMSPVEAVNTNQTVSVCGTCPLQQSIGGACYVNVGQAPLAVWNAWRKGKYIDDLITSEFHDASNLRVWLRHKKVRFGAYGDPAAVPTDVWKVLAESCAGYTGYTHQLGHKSFDKTLSRYCMLSVDTLFKAESIHSPDRVDYQLTNARTFRVITKDAPLMDNEILCPSIDGIECRDCLLCDGAGKQPNIAIEVHGSRKNKHNKKYSKANLIKSITVEV